jgi:hypothetical protein
MIGLGVIDDSKGRFRSKGCSGERDGSGRTDGLKEWAGKGRMADSEGMDG